MSELQQRPPVVIVGAGLAGAAMAIFLGRRGVPVEIYELRGDPRSRDSVGPSMNLGLSRRGLDVLSELGLAEQLLARAISMRGRAIHSLDGKVSFQPYGDGDDQVIHAVERRQINVALVAGAEACGNVRFFFEHRCLEVDKLRRALAVRDERSGETKEVGYRALIGADGVFSSVRSWMQRGERADYHQEYLDWGWKELRVPAGPGGVPRFEQHAFHLWPRGRALLFAHPNLDATFTCSFVLPFDGETSFAALGAESRLRGEFGRLFPDLEPLIPDLEEQFRRNETVTLVSTRTSLWHYGGSIVLVGDAAHAVVPFYAQGMNAALEDCALLDACMRRRGEDLEGAFREYQEVRRHHTDALAEISKQNFLELSDRVRSPWLRARRRLDLWLARLLGGRWTTLHARVTHTSVPFGDAVAMARRQDRILGWVLVVVALLATAGIVRLVLVLA